MVMEKNIVSKICSLEEKLNVNNDLILVAKNYCESNYDKVSEISTLYSMLEIISEKQKEISFVLDEILSV